MILPAWIDDPKIPEYVRKAAREAGEEAFAIESVPEDMRESVGRTRAVLILWSWFYYNGEPEVSDEVFDACYKYLQVREARYPELVTSLSPTQRVGKVMPNGL